MDKKTVLFVDDNRSILNTLELGLMGQPYERLFAANGPEALEILKEQKVHVIVSDLRMPEMNGLELLRIVREQYPQIVRVVLSGYTHISTLLHAINQGHVYKFIMKSWKIEDEFKPAILEALGYYDFQNQMVSTKI